MPGTPTPPPGDLLAERALADEYGVARTAVRRATAELRERGPIAAVHGRGTSVAGQASGSDGHGDGDGDGDGDGQEWSRPRRRAGPRRATIASVLDIGYSLSRRFPDPPQTDYRTADVRALRHDLFCGDVYLADTETDRELSTARGTVPVLDFAWALCDIAERLDRDPLGSRASRPQRAELDFVESADRLLFLRRFGWAEITADWLPEDEPPLTVNHGVLRREARDFLHDLIADLTDLHGGLGDNPVVWDLQARFPRV